MPICLLCGHDNPEDAHTCTKCGSVLPRPDSEIMQPVKQPTSGFAIISLTLLALALIAGTILMALPLALLLLAPAFCCGILAVVQSGYRRGVLRGWNFALVVIACVIFMPALEVGVAGWVFRVRDPERRPGCTGNQRQIAMAMLDYAQENDEMMPGKAGITPSSSLADKQQWRVKDIKGVSAEVFNCKSGKLSGEAGPATAEYAMNADVMGVGLGLIPFPYATLLTADTRGTDAIFSAGDIDRRHNGGFIASFGDGHVAYFPGTISTADPQQTPLQTGKHTPADYNKLDSPAVNPFIIQGATNVIDVKLPKWGGKPICFAYQGRTMVTNAAKNEGVYVSASCSQLPTEGTPGDVLIGTFANGVPAQKSNLVIPAAGGKPGYFTTFRLPPVTGKDKHGRPFTHYRMTGNNVRSVTITARTGKD